MGEICLGECARPSPEILSGKSSAQVGGTLGEALSRIFRGGGADMHFLCSQQHGAHLGLGCLPGWMRNFCDKMPFRTNWAW